MGGLDLSIRPKKADVYLDGEWIHFDSVEGDTLMVSPGGRGNRWTVPKAHDTSVVVHVGKSFVAIMDLPGFREDWGDTARRARNTQR